MTNNVNLVDEILSSIDEVETLTMESSVDVIGSMIDSYDKLFTIQENYTGDDIDDVLASFYQEGQIMDEVKAKGANDGTIKKILMFLPRLLQAIWNAIKKAWNGGKSADKATTVVDKMKKAGPDLKAFIEKVFSADSPEKLVGLVVGGITITAATAGIIFGIKKGLFDKLRNAINALRQKMSKIKYFMTHKNITADATNEETSVDHTQIDYISKSDTYVLPVSLEAIVNCYNIPREFFIALKNGKRIKFDEAAQCIEKFTEVRKQIIFPKKKSEYTSDQLNKLIVEIKEAIDATVPVTNEVNNALRANGGWDIDPAGAEVPQNMTALLKEMKDYGEIIGNVTNLFVSLNDAITGADKIIQTANTKGNAEKSKDTNESSKSDENKTSEGTSSTEGDKKTENDEKPNQTTTESATDDVDNDDDVVQESVSNGWYSR